MPQLFAVAYGRSSSDKQEASCPQQKEWAVRKAAALGAELVGWHEDDGIPGDRLDRPGLEKLFADLEQAQKARRPVAALLVFDQDRLSQATSWATGAIMERLMRLGVERLVMATEEVDLYDDGGRAIFGLKQDLNKRGYAKQLSKNVSRGMASLAAAGRWTGGTAPYGYRIAGEKRQRHLVPGPALEVEAVKELFRLAALGVLSTAALARLADERGWPVPPASLLRQRPAGKAPRWGAKTVGWLLRQPVYRGVIRYGRRRLGKYHQAVEGEPLERRGPSQQAAPALVREECHEPLIDRATFDRVQGVLTSRRVEARGGRRRPEGYAFSGRLVCGQWGAVMQGRSEHDFHGYVCSTWRSGGGCSRNGVQEHDLLERVALLLERELSTPATIKRLRKRLEANRTGRGETLRLAVERGRKHVAELERQVEAGGKRLLAIDADLVPVVQNELRRTKSELDAARADLEQIERQAASCHAEERDVEELLARLSALPKLLRDAESEKRCRVAQLAVAAIRLRFDVRQGSSGRKHSRWTGATVSLRGGGRDYEITLPSGAEYRAGGVLVESGCRVTRRRPGCRPQS